MQKKGTPRKVGTVSSCGQEGRGNDWGRGAGGREGVTGGWQEVLPRSLGLPKGSLHDNSLSHTIFILPLFCIKLHNESDLKSKMQNIYSMSPFVF